MVITNSWSVVLDFDGTLIGSSYRSLPEVLLQNLPADSEMRMEVSSLSRSCASRYRAGLLSPAEEVAWLEETCRIFAGHGLRDRQISDCLAGVRLRHGVRECLKQLRRRGVPVGIVSFGFAPFIRAVLNRNRADHLVTDVMAQELVFDETGTCVSWVSGTAATPSLKGRRSVAFSLSHGVPKSRLLAVGDSIGDRNLGCLKRNRIGLVEDQLDAAAIASFTHQVLVTSSFDPVTDWLLDKIDR